MNVLCRGDEIDFAIEWFAWSAVKGLLASVLPSRMSPVGYRSVTLGNGSVWAENREKAGAARTEVSTFASLVLFRRTSVVVRSGAVKAGQARSNRSIWGSTEAERPPRNHPAGNMLKHLTMNDLQYNRRSGGAKPVKVCQSDRAGSPSANRRCAGAALGRAARRNRGK